MIPPPRFRYCYKQFKNRRLNILDVGAGSHSPSVTKKVFPKCIYHGIDITSYNNSEEDLTVMDKYFEMDVTKLQFDEIPGNFYDLIVLSHIIEHLPNGDRVIAGLLSKLKAGGFIYIEYPGEKSKHLPKMKGSLNFYDDPTHVRLYSVPEIDNILQAAHCKVHYSGTRLY